MSMGSPPEMFAVFRLFVDGQLADEQTAFMGDSFEVIADIAVHQADLADAAAQRDDGYLVEIEFADGEHVRWGTDPDGMVIPVEVGLEGLQKALEARFRP